MLERVGLSHEHANRYPHQFSGGQRQRIGIARALVMNPDLVIADEAISALDVSIQAQVVNLMKDIQKETGCAYLFIAHDLSMVKYISDRIGVLHLGHLVETGSKEEIFENPVHPYTKSLLSAIPHTNPRVEKQRKAVGYDYAKSGIRYENGTRHLVGGTHYVLATDEEFAAWTAQKGNRRTMTFDMQKVYDYIDQHADEYTEFLRTLVRQPSIADTGEGIQDMVKLVKQSLRGIGAQPQEVPTPGNPVIYAEIKGERDKTFGFTTIMMCSR